jgi:hypothetical protein
MTKQLAAKHVARTDFPANSWQEKRALAPKILPTPDSEWWVA